MPSLIRSDHLLPAGEGIVSLSTSTTSVNRFSSRLVPPIPLVICERTGVWAEALRRTAHRTTHRTTRETISIVETRSVAECRKRLGERRATSAGLPLLVEFAIGSAPELCELLAWHMRRFGDAPRMVVAAREWGEYESIVREAGATSFLVSPREVGPCIAEYVRFRDDPTHVPVDDERTLTQRIRDSLPWRAPRESSAAGE